MKKLILALALLVTFVGAQQSKRVKSKQGNIELTKAMGGGDVVCTADFNDELTILKKEGDQVLLKLAKENCQGWSSMGNVEYVVAAPGDKSMKLEGVDVVGWLDNPAAVFVLENDAADFGGVDINRDFREYLQHTLDREKIESRNQEN